MWVGSVAIAGIPGFAGFFSKDEILWQTYSSPSGSKMLWIIGLVTAGLTAFYMWRLMNMTFYGKSRVKPEVAAHIHESPPGMTVPLGGAGGRWCFRGLGGRAEALESSGALPGLSSIGWSRRSLRLPSKHRNRARTTPPSSGS